MSDDWIVLVPADPRYEPEKTRQEKSRQRLSELALFAERAAALGGVDNVIDSFVGF